MAQKQTYISFAELKKLVRENKLKTINNYKTYYNSLLCPKIIPSNPNKYYEDEWIDWFDLFGQKRDRKKYKRRDAECITVPDPHRITVNIKNIDIYSFFPGKYKIENEELIVIQEPYFNLYSDYWITLYPYYNIHTIAKHHIVLNKVESNQIYKNYKQKIKNGKQKILEYIAESYTSYFSQKNIKGRIYIMNSKRSITSQMTILGRLYGKYIVMLNI